MARFYFHLHEGDQVISSDREGLDMADLSAARHEGQLAARELLSDAIKGGVERVPDAVVITDDSGRVVAKVALATVLPKPFRS
jgi:hypothetical protein